MSFTKSLIYSFVIACIVIISWGVTYEYPAVGFLFVGLISLIPLAILIHVIRLLTAILDELKIINKKSNK